MYFVYTGYGADWSKAGQQVRWLLHCPGPHGSEILPPPPWVRDPTPYSYDCVIIELITVTSDQEADGVQSETNNYILALNFGS